MPRKGDVHLVHRINAAMLLLSLLVPVVGLIQSPVRPRAPEPDPPRRVAVVVFDGVELLDFAGPSEVFSAARQDGRRAFDVFTVSSNLEPVTSQGFLEILPSHSYADCPPAEIVVVPGGRIPAADRELRRFLRSRSASSEILMSVCNGAVLLASAGLLEGLEVTSHRSALPHLELLVPSATVLENRRFVDYGGIVTSAGVSAGIDGALHVVERLHGAETAAATARYMEYDWRPDEISKLHREPGRSVQDHRTAQARALLGAQDLDAAVAVHATWSKAGDAPSEAILNRMGYALMNAGRMDEARRLFELVVGVHPDSANACDSLSELLETVGLNPEAATWARRTLELVETDEAARRASLIEAAKSRLARIEGLSQYRGFRCPPCGCRYDDRTFTAGGHCPDPDCSKELVRVGETSASGSDR